MSTKYTAQDVIKIATNEIGYQEKASNSNLDSKTGNAGHNNYTKYARDLANAGYYNGNKNGYDWCDVFVDWCHYQASGKNKTDAETVECQTGNYGAGCCYSMNYYKNAGRYDKNPKAGDQIFFSWSNNANDADHTGIVEKVANGTVYTIEGNTGNDEVKRKSYSTSYSCIIGYGHPKYSSTSSSTTNTTSASTSNSSSTKSITTIAKEVIAGKWGNGSTRKSKIEAAGYDYSKVQQKVNELMSGKTSTSYKVKVTAKDGLNCRSGAGTNYSKIKAYSYGTQLTITKESNGWGKTADGWVSLEWTTKI